MTKQGVSNDENNVYTFTVNQDDLLESTPIASNRTTSRVLSMLGRHDSDNFGLPLESSEQPSGGFSLQPRKQEVPDNVEEIMPLGMEAYLESLVEEESAVKKNDTDLEAFFGEKSSRQAVKQEVYDNVEEIMPLGMEAYLESLVEEESVIKKDPDLEALLVTGNSSKKVFSSRVKQPPIGTKKTKGNLKP